jgi:hypothetical protein
MQVIDSPKTGQGDGKGKPPDQKQKKHGLLYGGKETKIGFFAGRIAFVIVGAMFGAMLFFTVIMLLVSINEPYLTPYVENDKLYQDKIYLKVDGEPNYRELILVTEPGDYDQKEITQLPYGTSFQVIFTTKQLEIPENYFISFLDGPQKDQPIEGGYTRQSKYLAGDDKFYSLTVTPANNKPWPSGKYVIDAPTGGMFGGRNYAYFTVGEPNS